MIIFKVNLESILALECECNSPVATDCNTPGARAIAFYSPPDSDGLWIHRSVASVLNAKDAGDIRLGYEIEIFNSRGAHFVDPEGKPERELANHYRKQAEEVEMDGYHRLAVSLREAAASYEREAEQIGIRIRLED